MDSLESTAGKPETYEVWHFGDTEEGAKKLARLVSSGRKTATSALVWELEAQGFGLPDRGDIVVVADRDQHPYAIIEITEAEVISFGEIVDEQFAIDYGEGDTSLSSWKKWSWAYFSEICKELGREPSRDMLIACQRFRLLFAGQPEPAI